MAKSDHLFRHTVNRILAHLAQSLEPGATLPSEATLAALCGVSRSPVRAALAHLARAGIIAATGADRRLLRRPARRDYFHPDDAESRAAQVERVFLEMVLRHDLTPGQRFSETGIARRAGASTAVVREVLIRVSRFGLIAKKPRGSWTLQAFDSAFAEELADMRELVELQAIRAFDNLPDDHPAWRDVATLTARHRALAARIESHYNDFSPLDRDFHLMIVSARGNRFFTAFFDVIALVYHYHYHYQWEKESERDRNAAAIQGHLLVLDALARRDVAEATRRLAEHLVLARQTLLRAIAIATRR